MSDFGSSSRNAIATGTLNGASESRQYAMSSSAVAAAPGLSTTNAFTTSPFSGCGMPMAAASSTAGCAKSTSSTSRGYTL